MNTYKVTTPLGEIRYWKDSDIHSKDTRYLLTKMHLESLPYIYTNNGYKLEKASW
jgi:hypothetical protein